MNKTLSKTLSYWLRHAPEAADLNLDHAGWADTGAVLAALARSGPGVSMSDLHDLVEQSDKNRFELSTDGLRIRARQGHSIKVDADWEAATPPETLYHGTVERFLEPILREGLRPQARHHVHLSSDVETARAVGARRGQPIVLEVAAGAMHASGTAFFLSSNGVWLVEHVPAEHLHRHAPPPAGAAL